MVNALTEIYLDTEQDCACVSENAAALFDSVYLPERDALQCIFTLPSTIGGGTMLPQQHANLKLINCIGENASKRLAELIGVSALALEISLGAAIVTHTFAQVHLSLHERKKERRKSYAEI